jgi:glucose/arabinose dehydrogenase
LLTQLDVRVRDVRQGPDGYLYIATEKASDAAPTADESGEEYRLRPVDKVRCS